MKRTYFNKILVILALITTVISCSKNDEDNPYADGPAIEWVSGGTFITYNYSGGVLSGVNLYMKFNVIDKSGNVQILVKNKDINGDIIDTKTLVENVEYGAQYRITASCSLGDKSSRCSIIFDSPTAEQPASISITDYSLNINNVSISIKTSS